MFHTNLLCFLACTLAFSSTFSGAATDSCFANGQCRDSIHIASEILSDEYACLDFCKANDDCTWFTFSPQLHFCELFESCRTLDSEFCVDCISGEKDCIPEEPQCFVNGECRGIVDHFETRPSQEACLELCQTTLGCRWFTYHQQASACVLFQECMSLTTCSHCVSGERRCDATSTTTTGESTTGSGESTTGSDATVDPDTTTESVTTTSGDESTSAETTVTTTTVSGPSTTTTDSSTWTKVLVAAGQASGESTDNVEIVDLLSQDSCPSFPNFPYKVERVQGELGYNGSPIICGGMPSKTECHAFQNGIWTDGDFLNQGGYDFAMIKAPFQNQSVSLVLTGGNNITGVEFDRTEVLVNGQWETMPFPLPVTINNHCMVRFAEDSVMVISGQQNRVNSDKTFILSSEAEAWTEGPKLITSRGFHSCARIPTSDGSSEKSIIVVGGNIGNSLTNLIKSVEILDEGATNWRTGPELPMAICCGALVEHPDGGVVLIGGKNGTSSYLDTLYYLPHSGAAWILLPQKLTLARGKHTAFLVPDGIASYCKS